MRHDLGILVIVLILIVSLSGCSVERDPLLIYEPTFSHLRTGPEANASYSVSPHSTLAAGPTPMYD